MSTTSATPSAKSLTDHLLSLDSTRLINATQSPFLHKAATNQLPKSLLSKWLANDLLYMRGYIKLAGELLRLIKLPPTPASNKGHSDDSIEHRLVDWLVDALVNIRREERFFVEVSQKYGFVLDISDGDGAIDESKRIPGSIKFERLFESLTKGGEEKEKKLLPWLEGVVLFWATEKVYYTAWTWAKEQAESNDDGSSVEKAEGDGGGVREAMQTEFIPNWTNVEFREFVETLEGLLNEGVGEAVQGSEEMGREVRERAEAVWIQVLDAEAAFWPEV